VSADGYVPSPDEAASPISQRRSRILSIAGKRRIFVLEAPIWSALERMAAQRSLRLNALVGSIVQPDSADHQTSQLRAAAVAWLVEECDRRRDQLYASIRGVLSAIPVPAVAMSVDQQVIAQNSPFVRLTRPETPAGATASAEVTMRLDVPPSRLTALLAAEPNRAVSVPFTLRAGGEKRSGTMNTSLIDPTGSQPLLLCVLRKLGEEPSA
jgi:predicted DNA-binding ribbon-helix-helix protein